MKTEMTTMATRTTVVLAVILGAACAPARAGAPELKPMPERTPVATAAPAETPAPVATAAPVSVSTRTEPLQKHKDRMRWIEGPPSIPRSRMTVLEGNPKTPGAIYSVRVSVPAGTKLAPHTHPQDERVTVLEGSAIVGFGDVAGDKGTRFKAGDYYVNPAGMSHFVSFDEATTLQMTGIGPWESVPVAK